MAKLPKVAIRNLTSFSHFGQEGAQDTALLLAAACADMGDQDSADAWYLVASTLASGITPPNARYEGRVSAACRHMARALEEHAKGVDAQTERQAQQVEANKAKAAEKKQASK